MRVQSINTGVALNNDSRAKKSSKNLSKPNYSNTSSQVHFTSLFSFFFGNPKARKAAMTRLTELENQRENMHNMTAALSERRKNLKKNDSAGFTEIVKETIKDTDNYLDNYSNIKNTKAEITKNKGFFHWLFGL